MEARSIATGCKVNLFLRVTGCRADGYHTLETLFWPLSDPSDTVTVTFGTAPGLCMEPVAGDVPAGKGNLAYRAAELYSAASGVAPEWSIKLDKRIPVAAGLGGGSADAAAVLNLLEEHYRRLGREKLRETALRLGADVPFFLEPQPAVAHGVGEILTPLRGKLPSPHLLLVNPGFPVSARWAYRNFNPEDSGSGSLPDLMAAWENRDWHAVAGNIRNDLAPALWRKFPLLSVLRSELSDCGALAVEISGSGPTLFALMPDLKTTAVASEFLMAEHSGIRVFQLTGDE